MTNEEAAVWFEARLKNIAMPGAREMHKMAISALRAQGSSEKPNNWIRVEDRLPEDSEPVYVYCPTGRGSVEATMGMMARAHKYTGYTHWMPRAVPEPPKVEIE